MTANPRNFSNWQKNKKWVKKRITLFCLLSGYAFNWKGMKENLCGDWKLTHWNSKIVAELQLPHTNILSWAQQMPWPNGPAAIKAGLSKLQVDNYMAQLMLQKHINTIIMDLYRQEQDESMSLYSFFAVYFLLR